MKLLIADRGKLGIVDRRQSISSMSWRVESQKVFRLLPVKRERVYLQVAALQCQGLNISYRSSRKAKFSQSERIFPNKTPKDPAICHTRK